MKTFFLTIAFLVSTCLMASTMDLKGGATRFEGGEWGLNASPAIAYTIYTSDAGAIRGVDLGVASDLAIVKNGDFAYNVFVGPEGKVVFPYSYVKWALGWNYSRANGVNCNDLAVRYGVGLFYPVDGAKVGVDFTAEKLISGSKIWIMSIGPVVSFDL